MAVNPIDTTHYDSIPDVLKWRMQWIVFKLVEERRIDAHGNEFVKVLKRPHSPHYPDDIAIDPTDSRYWSTFDHCVAVCRSRPNHDLGIGFALAPGGGITCFDIDAKDPKDFDIAMSKVQKAMPPTWGETSISGKGRHYWYLGRLPFEFDALNTYLPGLEIYCGKRFIAMTGVPIGRVHTELDLADGQEIFDTFISEHEARQYRDDFVGNTWEMGRYIGLKPQRLLGIMKMWKPDTYAALTTGQWPRTLEGGRSEMFNNVIGDLDKVCGEPNVIQDVIDMSAMARLGYHGWPRNLKYWMRYARGGKRANNQSLPNATAEDVEFGRERAAEFSALFLRQRQVEGDQAELHLREQAIEAARLANLPPPLPIDMPDVGDESYYQVLGEVSAHGVDFNDFNSVFKAATERTGVLRPRMLLKPPPGKAGLVCNELNLMQRMYNPSAGVILTLMLGATIMQRGWFVADDPHWSPTHNVGSLSGLNLYITALMISGGGKERLLSTVNTVLAGAALYGDPTTGSANDFILAQAQNLCKNDGFASMQGLSRSASEDVRQLAVIDECHEVLAICKSQAGQASNVIPAVLKLFGQSDYNNRVNSVRYANQQNNIPACTSPSMSLLMCGIADPFFSTVNMDDVSSGLLARFLVFDITRQIRGMQHPYFKSQMSDDMYRGLINPILKLSLEKGFNPDALNRPYVIKTSQGAAAEFRSISEHMAGIVLDAKAPEGVFRSAGLSRVVQTAIRIAGIIAVFDNHLEPVISQEHAKWALDLIMLERSNLLNTLVTSDVGVAPSARIRRIASMLLEFPKAALGSGITKAHKELNVCPEHWIRQRAENLHSLFTKGANAGANREIDDVIKQLQAIGLIHQVAKVGDRNYGEIDERIRMQLATGKTKQPSKATLCIIEVGNIKDYLSRTPIPGDE